MRRLGMVLVLALGVAAIPRTAQASVIDFEALTGPTVFGSAAQNLQFTFGTLTVDITGGTLLDQTTNLPANQTTVYGTVGGFCCNGLYQSTLTLTFSAPITNFYLDVINGNTSTVTYRLADNAANQSDFSLVPNTQSGATQIGFAATGTVVSVSALTGLPYWDFFIDNIHFNEDLPGTAPVPEPASLTLLGLGLAGMAGRRWRQRKRA